MMKSRKCTYLIASITALILAVLVWLIEPNEYEAQIKISDEYTETDLAVGLNNISAKLRETMGLANQGVNDMEVYCKVLKTDDFAAEISQIKLPQSGETYGQYLARKDVVEEVKRNIEYNLSTKEGTLVIRFVDKNPCVATIMLDSVVAHLQKFVTNSRRKVFKAWLINANREKERTAAKYHLVQRKYSIYADSHDGELTEEGKLRKIALERDRSEAFRFYVDAAEQCYRYQALMEKNNASFAVIKANEVYLRTANHLLGYVVVFVFFALISVKCFFLIKAFRIENKAFDLGNVFSPWFLTLSVWFVLGIALLLLGDKMDPVPDIFYKCIFVWIIVLALSSFLTYNLLPAKSLQNGDGINVNVFLFNLFFILAMVMTPLYVYQIYKLVTMFDTKDIIENIRILAVEGEGHGILNYTMVVNQSLLLVSLWCYPKIPLWKLICTILCCVIFAVANMEKLTFFLVFVVIVYVLFEKKIIKARTIAIFVLALFFVFYLFTISRSGDDASESLSVMDFLGIYLISPPIAFGHLRPIISQDLCPESLWTIYSYIGNFINSTVVEHDAFGEFVYVPVPTNVYTIMRPFYQDGGVIGVAFFALLYGIGSGVVYRYARNGQPFSICLYTYIVFVLALQFFDELIFAAIPLFLQRMILIALMCSTVKITFRKGDLLTSKQI